MPRKQWSTAKRCFAKHNSATDWTSLLQQMPQFELSLLQKLIDHLLAVCGSMPSRCDGLSVSELICLSWYRSLTDEERKIIDQWLSNL